MCGWVFLFFIFLYSMTDVCVCVCVWAMCLIQIYSILFYILFYYTVRSYRNHFMCFLPIHLYISHRDLQYYCDQTGKIQLEQLACQITWSKFGQSHLFLSATFCCWENSAAGFNVCVSQRKNYTRSYYAYLFTRVPAT